MVILLVVAIGAATHAIPVVGPAIGGFFTYTAATLQFIERVLVG